MNLKKIVLLLFLAVSMNGFSQALELSPLSKISLLTVGTGNELSSSFGHTAVRIQDPTINMDLVFGYGGFDFSDPLFYYKFTTGKLDYSMTGHHYDTFLQSYKIENRWVRQQALNLSLEQRNTLFRFLQNNYREENRYYKYDFLFDNCATKIPEVFKEVYTQNVDFDFQHLEDTSTFRQLIHETLNTNAWATFGIDLALGSVIDREATPWEHLFLPFYVEKQFENTKINGEDLVVGTELVLDDKPISNRTNFFLSPLFWVLVLLIIVLARTFFDNKRNTRSRWLDFALFFTTGLAGLLICFLWFATDHSSTKINFNFLWAFPLNLVVAFVLVRKKKSPIWIRKYLWTLVAFLVLAVLLWLLKIQIFSPLLIPILVSLMLRYLFLTNYLKSQNSKTL